MKDEKAVSVAYSWALSWGLSARPATSVDEGDLVVEGLRVGVDSDAPGLDVVLDASKLNSRNVDDAVREMWKLTRACGRGEPCGSRKNTGRLRANSDDYEATSMRLTPFERAANPPAWMLKTYSPTVKREADCAARRYINLCKCMQMDEEDLYTMGMIYLCVFLHRYRDLADEKQNGGKLTHFLRQEFARWASVTCDHLKSIKFSAAGVPIGEIVGSPVVGAVFKDALTFDHASESLEPSYSLDPEFSIENEEVLTFASETERVRYEKKRAVADGKYLKSRRKAAAAELEDRLSNMSHDNFVIALTNVVESERHPEDAREEAKRRLSVHVRNCKVCGQSKDNSRVV